MSAFLTELKVVQVEDASHEGRGTWRVLEDLVYESDLLGHSITVPAGFVTDFASVPRIPLIFDFLGDRGNLAATLHDWLYCAPAKLTSRETADKILLEALLVQGVEKGEAMLIYEGVRIGGAHHYNN